MMHSAAKHSTGRRCAGQHASIATQPRLTHCCSYEARPDKPTTHVRHRTGGRSVVCSVGLIEECSASNWRTPLTSASGCHDVIVALGKFDALHLGHQSLASRAACMGGQPCLLSFSGMAEVLGWPIRQPLVAACDRPRVLNSWEAACHGRVPRQRSIPFHDIRTMSPEAFVKLLAVDLQAVGVVAGSNYRFGYKAAGDAETLQQLGAKYGLQVSIVDLMEDPEGKRQLQQQQQQQQVVLHGRQHSAAVAAPTSAHATVRHISSTKARELLSKGDVSAVASLLGRQYRLVVSFDTSVLQSTAHCRPLATSGNGNGNGAPAPSSPSPPQHADEVHYQVVLPSCAFLNQPPACGLYDASLAVAPRPDDDDGGGLLGAAAAAGGAASPLDGGLSGGVCRIPSAVLPLELESGAGMPLTVQVAPDGLYLPNEALRVAMSSAVQHRPDGPLPRTMYAVIDLGRLITLH